MFKGLIKNILNKFGIEITRLDKRFVSMVPQSGKSRGNVLLSYIIDPFLLKDDEKISLAHTHDWESFQIAEIFLELGYSVDVIQWSNKIFVPKKDYTIFFSARTNFQRIANLLNKDCIKIVHLDTAHWLFNSCTEYKRCLELNQRRGVILSSFRPVEPNWSIEHADFATILGNEFTIGTYEYAKVPMYPLPVPSCRTYPWPENKDFEFCRNRFLWFGSYGLVHKGLDLVLEAFTDMPDVHLTVCGAIDDEKDFVKTYHKELYETPNIKTVGWVNLEDSNFIDITNECLGLIYPSCCEGQSGSVITCLQAGLIPIVSHESGVDIDDFGLTLKTCSLEEIGHSIHRITKLSAKDLENMARRAWQYARDNHTKERYSEEFRRVIKDILSRSTEVAAKNRTAV